MTKSFYNNKKSLVCTKLFYQKNTNILCSIITNIYSTTTLFLKYSGISFCKYLFAKSLFELLRLKRFSEPFSKHSIDTVL